MVRAAGGLAREPSQTPSRQQPRPLSDGHVRTAREAIGDVVDYDEDFKTINGQHVRHRAAPPYAIKPLVRQHINPCVPEIHGGRAEPAVTYPTASL